MEKDRVQVYHVNTGKEIVKLVSIKDLIELMSIMKHEIPNKAFGLMPQDYMKLWNTLNIILNKLNRENGRKNN